MAFPPARVKQSTNTQGTGAVVLNAAAASVRSWLAGFGAGTALQVRYVLSKDSLFEAGYGTLNTATQTLTRDFVATSSNANALVSLPTGTTDVFFDFLPGDRQIRTISSNTTLDRADLGVLIRCTQTSDITVTLPAVATVPGGANMLSMGYSVRNDGSNNSIVWIATNGAETLDGSSTAFPLFGGETVEVLSLGTTWRTIGRPVGWRSVAFQAASNSASVDFSLPLYPGTDATLLAVRWKNVRLATDGAELRMLMSANSGATFEPQYANSRMMVTGTSSIGAASAWADGALILTADIDNTSGGHTSQGWAEISPGSGGVRKATVIGESWMPGNTTGPTKISFGGHCASDTNVNYVRLLASSGNISLGQFSLSAIYR